MDFTNYITQDIINMKKCSLFFSVNITPSITVM